MLKTQGQRLALAGRILRITDARVVANILNITATVLSIWGMVYPRPYGFLLSLLIALPVLGLTLIALSGGAYVFDNDRYGTRTHLGYLLLLPGFALALRATIDVRLVNWQHSLFLGGSAVQPLLSPFRYLIAPKQDDRSDTC